MKNIFLQNFSKIEIPRNIKFLNWRFINNPSVNYHIYKILDDSEIFSYFVLKIL